MPTRIDEIFSDRRGRNQATLMPFVTAGYPSLDVTRRVLLELAANGANIVELGLPFSDPIADGPVIAASMHDALEAGVTPGQVFDMVRECRADLDIGLIAMTSESIVYRVSPGTFVATAAEAGIDGLIVPDIDLDAAADLRVLTDEHDMSLSLLVAPASPSERIERIVSLCSGFVYLLARAGLTGEQTTLPSVEKHVQAIRRLTDLPIAVGFGIRGPEQVAEVTTHADAAIVGSALVRRMGDADDPVAAAGEFVRELAEGLRS